MRRSKSLQEIIVLVALTLVGACASSQPPLNSTVALNQQAPEGWVMTGRDAIFYRIDIDPQMQRREISSATLLSTQASAEQFALLSQQVAAKPYRAARVRFSGYLSSAEVLEQAFLWMRVDTDSLAAVAFDNMQRRPVQGTTRWKLFEIILDVPADATIIAMGAGMVGTGQIWINDCRLELVDEAVDTTNRNLAPSALDDSARQRFWQQALGLPINVEPTPTR